MDGATPRAVTDDHRSGIIPTDHHSGIIRIIAIKPLLLQFAEGQLNLLNIFTRATRKVSNGTATINQEINKALTTGEW